MCFQIAASNQVILMFYLYYYIHLTMYFHMLILPSPTQLHCFHCFLHFSNLSFCQTSVPLLIMLSNLSKSTPEQSPDCLLLKSISTRCLYVSFHVFSMENREFWDVWYTCNLMFSSVPLTSSTDKYSGSDTSRWWLSFSIAYTEFNVIPLSGNILLKAHTSLNLYHRSTHTIPVFSWKANFNFSNFCHKSWQ